MANHSGPSAPTSASMLSQALDRVDRIRRRVLWHRRPIAALVAAAAAYLAVQAATAPPPQTVPVWTAARDLAAGTVLTSGDLTQRRFTPESVPADRLISPGHVLGRTLAAPLGSGAALTTSQFLGDDWMVGHPGLRAVPVRITDPAVVPLLRVGDHLTLMASDPQSREHPSRQFAVTVLAIPAAAERAGGGLTGRLVVLGVGAAEAESLASVAVSDYLSVVWGR